MMTRTGVVLLNMGGPWILGEVKPFLFELFNDPLVINFPGGGLFQKYWAGFIASRRAPKVQKRYAQIGGGSPLLMWTQKQAKALQERLVDVPVEIAMRYASPRSEDAIGRLKKLGCNRIIAMPLFPQYCKATTGSSLADLQNAMSGSNIELKTIASFHNHDSYLKAMAQTVREGINCLEKEDKIKITVVFSAHSIPQSLANGGDPYVTQVKQSLEGVLKRLKNVITDYELAFQSRTGPVKWVGPDTVDVIKNLGQQGAKNVLVVPLSFVSDHIETLYELDIELAQTARISGIKNFRRAPALNDSELFINALKELVEGVL